MPEAFLYTLRCNPLRIYPPIVASLDCIQIRATSKPKNIIIIILSYVCAPNISG